MAIDCKKCKTGYCPVCKEQCPECGEADVADAKTMQTRKQMRDHMNRTVGTPQAQQLKEALAKLGVYAQLEYNDGHKTVDLAIHEAKLYIEVDGIQHFTKAEQIERDFKRTHYSDKDGYSTFYVTNQIVEHYVDDVAKALAEVVGRRMPK